MSIAIKSDGLSEVKQAFTIGLIGHILHQRHSVAAGGCGNGIGQGGVVGAADYGFRFGLSPRADFIGTLSGHLVGGSVHIGGGVAGEGAAADSDCLATCSTCCQSAIKHSLINDNCRSFSGTCVCFQRRSSSRKCTAIDCKRTARTKNICSVTDRGGICAAVNCGIASVINCNSCGQI